MLKPVRAVSPVEKPRCPQCHCFVRLDSGTCSACGSAFALVAGTRQGQDSTGGLGSQTFQNGPQGNAHIPPSFQFRQSDLSNLQPDGKIRKPRKPSGDSRQLDLFRCVPESFSFTEDSE